MKFSDILGQETVKQRLRSMAESGRIPHALLLEGPEGVGKLAMARAFAQYLHCSHPTDDGEPCGQCPSCIQYQTFNQPDTFFVFPIYKKKSGKDSFCDEFIEEWNEFLGGHTYADFQTWVKILDSGTAKPVIYNNEADEILRKISVKSYSSDYKIMILWLPEKMNEQCANHLLKIIEEPYEGTLLLFVSDTPEEILPTIYSRVQRVAMKPLSTDLIAGYLEERYAVERATALSVANLSGGSVTKAEALLEVDDDSRMFLELFKRLMRSAYVKNLRDLKDWSEEVAGLKREKCCFFLTYVAKLVRENFIYNIGNASLNYMTGDEAAFSSEFSPFINERNVDKIIAEVDRAVDDISRNANAKIVLFDFAIKMIIAIKS